MVLDAALLRAYRCTMRAQRARADPAGQSLRSLNLTCEAHGHLVLCPCLALRSLSFYLVGSDSYMLVILLAHLSAHCRIEIIRVAERRRHARSPLDRGKCLNKRSGAFSARELADGVQTFPRLLDARKGQLLVFTVRLPPLLSQHHLVDVFGLLLAYKSWATGPCCDIGLGRWLNQHRFLLFDVFYI